MNIHEYQAKALLKTFGVPVLEGYPATTVAEATEGAKKLGGPVWVVKAQIHAGGRGKAGGVKVVKSVAEVTSYAQELLGKTLITHQTSPQGQKVRRLYVEAGCAIQQELYFALLLDRTTSKVTFVVSTQGGMDIEEVAHKTPKEIHQAAIDCASGFQPFHARKMAKKLGLTGDVAENFGKLAAAAYRAYTALDADLLEINPLVVAQDSSVVALDAKMSFDNNALYRHPEVMALRDLDEEDPAEIEASKHELSYIKLDGEIGCMVNGAGLAMATMDIIKTYGSEPANFLDVGGGATQERVTAAFKLILSDPHVKGVLVNIFGGIMRCDIIAQGILAAAREVKLHVPLVVRLEGTKVNEGKKILAESRLPIIPADDLGQAAQAIVKAVKEAA